MVKANSTKDVTNSENQKEAAAERGQREFPSTGMVKANSTKDVTYSENQKEAAAERGQREFPSTGMVKANSTKDVTYSENQKDAELVKEYKALPTIRKRGDTMPHISYRPNRVWGGSVHSFLATVNEDSRGIDDLVTGKTVNMATSHVISS